jgi:hypothetical protein
MRSLFLLLFCGCSTGPGVAGAGWVSVSINPNEWYVFAAFDKLPPPQNSCVQTAGDCQWLPPGCTVGGSTHISVGTLAVDDSDHQLRMMQRAKDGMYSVGGYDGGFQPGDAIRVSAPGGDIDGFDGKITMPEKSKLDPMPSPAPRNQDLAVSWTGGSDKLFAAIYFQGGAAGQISCVFDSAQKKGVVPSSLFQSVQPGTHGFLAYENQRVVEVRPDLSLYANAQRDQDDIDIEFQ